MQIVAASHLLTMNGPVISGGAMAHDDGQIIAIGTRGEMTALFAAPVIDFPGCIIMPGLVNAHSHLELTHFPAWKIRKGLDYMPRTYVDWIIQVIKIARGLTGEERTISLKEGIAKSLEAGTTTIGEIVTDFSLLPTYAASPLKGRLLLEMIGQDPLQYKSRLTELDKLLAGFLSGNLLPGISPHAPHTVSDQLFKELLARAAASNVPLVTHLAESAEELSFAHDSTGAIATLLYPFINWESFLTPPRHTTPTHHLASLGVLGPDTVAVHGVQVTPDDAELLQRHHVGVILCPRSNERLNVGRAPVAMYRNQGIRLALGTDSLASNDSLSLWDELRFLLAEFPDTFTAAEALALATIDGARLLKVDHLTGSLATGKAADFIVVQPDRLPPSADRVAAELINGNRVLQSCINGQPC